jgi:hypothetical protein
VRTSPRPDRRHRPTTRVLTSVLVALTTYLLMPRNHAEEIGSGWQATWTLARGEGTVAPWTVLAMVVLVLAAAASAAGDRRLGLVPHDA